MDRVTESGGSGLCHKLNDSIVDIDMWVNTVYLVEKMCLNQTSLDHNGPHIASNKSHL